MTRGAAHVGFPTCSSAIAKIGVCSEWTMVGNNSLKNPMAVSGPGYLQAWESMIVVAHLDPFETWVKRGPPAYRQPITMGNRGRAGATTLAIGIAVH